MVNKPQGHPRFSIVSAVYNVGRYLGEFIDSVDRQTFPSEAFEVIVVDDGSTDDSRSLLEAWRERRPDLVTVISQENGGQARARNAGLELARGEWVTFTDPDDVIEPDYLAEVAAFLDRRPDAALVATNRLMLMEETGELLDTHPLRKHFHSTRMVDLDTEPEYFHGSAPAAFYRREVLEDSGLRFDPEVRPNFEDGHFSCRYLLDAPRPLVGFVTGARYHYRKREDATSTLQNSLGDVDRYTKVLRNGYLDVLRRGADRDGRPPEWLQNFVLYELSYYFSSQDRHAGAVTAARGSVADEFHALMGEILGLLDDGVIASFSVRRLKPAWRHILLHSYKSEPWCQPYVVLDELDEDQALVRLTYHFTGPLPDERFFSRGERVEPTHAKVRSIAYHGRTLLRQRIVWLPSQRAVRVERNGEPAGLLFEPVPRPAYRVTGPAIRRNLTAAGEGVRNRPGPPAADEQEQPSRADRLVKRLARTRWVRRRYRNAWVLMDRIHDADDSGEILFHYLRQHRPQVNAWFTVERGTPDWDRLRRSGVSGRLLAHGSLQWKLAMLNCRHLVSSHADAAVIDPPELRPLTERNWRFTFLQHGVIKDDLSAWLNPKQISTFVTSTPQEHASIAGDDTAYVFTTKEVKLTGLPRFDKLLAVADRVPSERRDLVLLAPTWRNWLVPTLAAGSQRRSLHDSFLASEFAEQWTTLLQSQELANACKAHGLTLGFLPHPNFADALHAMELPDHLQPLSYDVPDVQEYFARAAVLVTDYSSVAFNTAYLGRPVVYFQFDAERVLTGGHVGRRGYFDYQRDGFGPVVDDVDAAVDAICALIERGCEPAPEHLARIQATFPLRDGRCCERVADAIDSSGRPAPARFVAAPGTSAPGAVLDDGGGGD